MDFELSIFLESIPALLMGARITLELTVISVVIGLVSGRDSVFSAPSPSTQEASLPCPASSSHTSNLTRC